MRIILVVMMVLAMTTAAWAAADPTEEPGTTMIECPDCGTVGICMSCYGLDENCEVCGGTFVCATCGGEGYIQSPSHFYNTPFALLPPVIAIALGPADQGGLFLPVHRYSHGRPALFQLPVRGDAAPRL